MNAKKEKGFFRRMFGSDTENAAEAEPNQETDASAEVTPPAQTETDSDTPETTATETASDTIQEQKPEPDSEPVAEPEQVKDSTSTPQPVQPTGWFTRLQSGLSKTSTQLTTGISGLFTKAKLDADSIQDLEDVLIQADLGVAMATRITDRISETRYDKELGADDVRAILSDEVATVLKPVAKPLEISASNRPHVIMMVGVNGSGKTTTIGKLASKLNAEGKKVMLVAGDTFRAAAVEQLDIWASRTNAKFMSRDIGADAAGLAFDAIKEARAENVDVVLIDTAGRLQNKATLMAELEKIIRVIRKIDETAPHSVLLVLDATTGQNALNQVEVFLKQAGVTGLVMTKLDGTARGGILVAIAEKYGLPIHAIGIGEDIDDLQPFDANDFANAIARN